MPDCSGNFRLAEPDKILEDNWKISGGLFDFEGHHCLVAFDTHAVTEFLE